MTTKIIMIQTKIGDNIPSEQTKGRKTMDR